MLPPFEIIEKYVPPVLVRWFIVAGIFAAALAFFVLNYDTFKLIFADTSAMLSDQEVAIALVARTFVTLMWVFTVVLMLMVVAQSIEHRSYRKKWHERLAAADERIEILDEVTDAQMQAITDAVEIVEQVMDATRDDLETHRLRSMIDHNYSRFISGYNRQKALYEKIKDARKDAV